jgi:hypothetical protein
MSETIAILLIQPSCSWISSSGREESRILSLKVLCIKALNEAIRQFQDCLSHSSRLLMAITRGQSSVSRVVCSYSSRALKLEARSPLEAIVCLYQSKKVLFKPGSYSRSERIRPENT